MERLAGVIRPFAVPGFATSIAALAVVCLIASACDSRGSTPTAHVASVREIGIVPDPPGSSNRDGGFSAAFAGHSVWVFGDTFFAQPAADGYQWRASTWSWTDDSDASNGLDSWQHGLGGDGKPLQLIPHTPDEQAFDDAHNGTPCPAGTDCGARHTAWAGPVVVDPNRGALVFYSKEHTEPSGAFAFTGAGASIAVWPSADASAVRTVVANAPDATDPTRLFTVDEPPWGAAALVESDTLYAYACPGGNLSAPCRVARVALASALDRAAWLFWNGSDWVSDWRAAVPVFEGAPQMSVHYSEYLQKWVAFYAVPLTSTLALRLAPAPEGPWSSEERFGEGATPGDGTWDYALLAHHELARQGGQVEYISYFQPGSFLDGKIHLMELAYR
jgi:hypothetical protein